MCYNCGCGLKDDPMGQGVAGKGGFSITDETFELAGKSQGMTKRQAQEEAFKLLKKELEGDEQK